MGMFDYIGVHNSIIDTLNSYLGCEQELDAQYQTSIEDLLGRFWISADTSISEVSDGIYPLRHFCGHTLYFVVKDGFVRYWLLGYSFNKGSYSRSHDHLTPKAIATTRKGNGLEWRVITPDSAEHIQLMNDIQRYLYGSDIPLDPVVPPMVEILSIVDLETFAHIRSIMEERGVCDYLIYKLNSCRDKDVTDIMFGAIEMFPSNDNLFNRLNWLGCGYTHDDIIRLVEHEKDHGAIYAYKITPSGKWEQLLSAIERLHRSYTF